MFPVHDWLVRGCLLAMAESLCQANFEPHGKTKTKQTTKKRKRIVLGLQISLQGQVLYDTRAGLLFLEGPTTFQKHHSGDKAFHIGLLGDTNT